jgi:hypothetical protein
VKKEMFIKNKAIRRITKKEKRVWTDYGIVSKETTVAN